MYISSLLSVSLYIGLAVAHDNVAARQYGNPAPSSASASVTESTSTVNPSTPSDTSTTSNAVVTGDSKCTALMCVTATVNGSVVDYALQSTGSQNLGWMAMGFGEKMANSPMVIMWPNTDGSITLSQRKASGNNMPTVDKSPPRVATLAKALSSSTTDTRPKFVYSIPINSDSSQRIIWAFGTTKPSSSAVDATLRQHLDAGTLLLDLTKTTTSTDGSGSVPEPDFSSLEKEPLAKYQKVIVAHGIFCAVGFLFFLPAGALLARYLRTSSPKWFRGHWIIQWLIAGPTIVVGIGFGVKAVNDTGGTHFDDEHKRFGLIILILYLVQLLLGAFIHFIKSKNRTTRPPQNYIHAIIGIAIVGLGFYQVRQGYRDEWVKITNRQPVGNAANIVWYVWAALVPVLYFAGLALLRRQFKQEQQSRQSQVHQNGEYRLAARENKYHD